MSNLFKDGLRFIKECYTGLIINNRSKMAAQLRKKSYATDCFIDTGVIIVNKRNFQCGNGCALYHGTYILNTNGSFSMGENSHFGALSYVNVAKGKLNIGDDVAIGPGTSIIVYSNYYQEGKKVTDVRTCGDIKIGNNVFIGANCTILPGSVINNNVIVGAGSLIKNTLENNSIYAGSPCKLIKRGWYK